MKLFRCSRLSACLGLASAAAPLAADGGALLHGVSFARVEIRRDGLAIGWIAEDATVAGRPCKQGWLHLHATGIPAAFTVAQPFPFGSLTIPRDTWVRQNPEGTIILCAFPGDIQVKGHWCRGSGGSKGVSVAFHPDGTLKQFFPVRDTRIDGVPCRSGLIHGWVTLHQNGRLRSCLLDAEWERDGARFRAGTRIELDAEGHPTATARAIPQG